MEPPWSEPYLHFALKECLHQIESDPQTKLIIVCAARYPEAVPLRSTEALVIAPELLKLLAHEVFPREILTDQGTNFTSQLMSDLYSMLKVPCLKRRCITHRLIVL